jgi:hypothetical protein
MVKERKTFNSSLLLHSHEELGSKASMLMSKGSLN